MDIYQLSRETAFKLSQVQHSGVLLRAGHQANWPAARMILLAWFDHLVESFSYKEVQLKSFAHPWKPVATLLKMLLKPLITVEYDTFSQSLRKD